ncbi:MAG: BON domain-containing protein [Anaerolineae bacterium]|nr:BON domain-containing protein [Anaerolineae bacterium]
MDATKVQRPDVDIAADIRRLERSFDPLKQARGHVSTLVQDGHVVLSGHVRSTLARRVLVDNVPDIPGVLSMDASALFDDETLRLKLGHVLPRGVFVRVNYGTVVLTGHLPDSVVLGDLIAKVGAVPGVRPDGVVTEFF